MVTASNTVSQRAEALADKTRMRGNSFIDSFNPKSNMTPHTQSVNLGNPPMVKYQNYAVAATLDFD